MTPADAIDCACAPITVADIEAIEGRAIGHSDYGPKIALYIAERVVYGPGDPR